MVEARGVTKTFPGVRALDAVNFSLRRGEVHALVGENGAGKTTLIHVLGGVLRPDAGEILVEGRPVRFRHPADAARCGIGLVFQELSLAGNLSVAENIFAHRQPVRAAGLIDWPALHARTRELLARFDLDVDPRTPVRRLPAARQQVVEILKALSRGPRVLVLDEPTSSLTAPDAQHLFAGIARMKAAGASVIYISHHLPEIFRVADRVTVLRDGRVVGTCAAAEATEQSLVRSMVGRDLANIYGERQSEVGPEVLRVREACGERFSGVSFSLRRGEILGVAGLVGAGRTELARALLGAPPMTAGTVALDGRPVRIRSPADGIAAGLAYLTEDRKQDGLFLDMTVRANCVAPSLADFAGRLGWMDERRIDRFAEDSRRRLRIATPGIAQRVRNLSGGNQQKVLLAMWMGARPKVLIVDEPTRGVDVGARSEIYGLLRQLAAAGAAILMISSDLPEILGLSDRILVMRQGRLAGEFLRGQATAETIIARALPPDGGG
ncbi:MAG: sugar ABC transporter ATP-binding protein [Planctomycetes bacterium]|nr:sugar ABC transporter ATP-binding protein [Planctomycetota bacterium]